MKGRIYKLKLKPLNAGAEMGREGKRGEERAQLSHFSLLPDGSLRVIHKLNPNERIELL